MTLPTVTAEMLEAHGPCSCQLAVFREHWPDGARLTLPTLRKVARLGLDLGWFAKNFLSAPALAAFQEVMALAFTAYREAEATALHAAIREHGLRDQGVPPEPTQGGDGE